MKVSQRIKARLGAFGPGLIMASSAIGGSHIISSTQAGAQYGFQLAAFIIVVNLLKYPFYRFAFDYTLVENKSVLVGYSEKSPLFLIIFLIFNLFATMVNIAGGALLSAALLMPLLPFSPSITVLSLAVLLSFLLLLSRNSYAVLDWLSKRIMLLLTMITVLALLMAMYSSFGSVGNVTAVSSSISKPSPWALASIPFLIALMGWMPAPMELSVASSLWVIEKNRQGAVSTRDGLLDLSVGYVVTILLALVFMALGALVHYGKSDSVAAGGQYVAQFVDLYALVIGEWTRWFVGLLAFVCIYGTTIAAMDGYSRTNMSAVNLLLKRDNSNANRLFYWMLGAAIAALIVILFFQGSVKQMIPFAMTLSFISAPIFAWLNLSLYQQRKQKSSGLLWWAWLGLLFLIAMLMLFWVQKLGFLG